MLAFVLPLITGALVDLSETISSALLFLIGLNIVCLPLAWSTRTGLEA